MFKKISFILLFYIGFSSYGICVPTEVLRKVFHESVLHSHKLPLFVKEVERIKNPTAIEKAYIGALEALKAREAWNPIEKLVHIQSFRDYLVEAIDNDSNNLEIRFIRFSVEYNIPSFLRSKKSILEDKHVILSRLRNISTFEVDSSFVNYILTFFEDTKTCTDTEIQMIRDRLKS